MKRLLRIISLLFMFACPTLVEAGPVTNPSFSYLCYNVHHNRKKCPKCLKWDNMDPKKKAVILKERQEKAEKRLKQQMLFAGICFMVLAIGFIIMRIMMKLFHVEQFW